MLLLLAGCMHSLLLTEEAPSRRSKAETALPGADVLWFDLEGTDRIDLLESCLESCPRDESGTPVGSLTAWSVDWQWVRGAGEPCEIAGVSTAVDVTVALPRWDPPPEADPALVVDWTSYIDALLEHEGGHVRLVRRLAEGSETTVQAAGCTDAHEVSRAMLAQIRTVEHAYDDVTENGRRQGAAFFGLDGRTIVADAP